MSDQSRKSQAVVPIEEVSSFLSNLRHELKGASSALHTAFDLMDGPESNHENARTLHNLTISKLEALIESTKKWEFRGPA